MQALTHTCAAWLERFTGGIMVHGAEQIYSKEAALLTCVFRTAQGPPPHDSQIFLLKEMLLFNCLLNIFNVPKAL